MSHAVEMRVRYHETDKMGVVNHIGYFRWFEVGRAELLRSLNMAMLKLEKLGCYLVLKEEKCMFRSPAWYDDMVKVSTRMTEVREKGVRFEYVVTRGDVKLAEGYTIHVCTDGAGKVKPFPERFLKALMVAVDG